MEQRLTPEVFYGSAIAALVGLLFGLLLHGVWQKHPGGPQILLSSAAAAEAVSPPAGDASTDPQAAIETAGLDTGPVAPHPLPVTRLAPDMFDLRPAAADGAERQDADDVVADDVRSPPSAISTRLFP